MGITLHNATRFFYHRLGCRIGSIRTKARGKNISRPTVESRNKRTVITFNKRTNRWETWQRKQADVHEPSGGLSGSPGEERPLHSVEERATMTVTCGRFTYHVFASHSKLIVSRARGYAAMWPRSTMSKSCSDTEMENRRKIPHPLLSARLPSRRLHLRAALHHLMRGRWLDSSLLLVRIEKHAAGVQRGTPGSRPIGFPPAGSSTLPPSRMLCLQARLDGERHSWLAGWLAG